MAGFGEAWAIRMLWERNISDLSLKVQESLNKADSAIQDISSKVDNSIYSEDKKTFALKTIILWTAGFRKSKYL